MKKTVLILAPMLALLAACGSTNTYLANKTSTVEMYHIFDIRTTAATAVVAKAAADGLGRNSNDVATNMPLQMGVAVPATPGRFTLVDMGAKLAGTGMGAMLQMAAMQNGGTGMKTANCEGAAWTARAQRTISGSSKLTLHGCLYRYQKGYHLDTYAVFQKVEGGLQQVSRDIAFKMVGTPEEWVNKTILDMVRSIEQGANAQVTHLEGQPELGNEPGIARLGQR
ncbi:MAG: hypothetical protein V4693_06390 [Pseudomonadota bacterium]